MPPRSLLVAMIEGRAKKKMPPKSDLRPDEISTLRAWIDGGAPFSECRCRRSTTRCPRLAQQGGLLPQVTGLAYRPDGGELAIGGYREVRRSVTAGGAPAKAFSGSARPGARGQIQPRRLLDGGRRRRARLVRRGRDLRRGVRRAPPHAARAPRLRLPAGDQPGRHAPRQLRVRQEHPCMGRRERDAS